MRPEPTIRLLHEEDYPFYHDWVRRIDEARNALGIKSCSMVVSEIDLDAGEKHLDFDVNFGDGGGIKFCEPHSYANQSYDAVC